MKKLFFRDWQKVFLGSASVLAALYVGLSPRFNSRLYFGKVFRPFPYPEGDYDVEQLVGIKREDVWFSTPDDVRLHGWFFSVPASKKTILFSHGNTGNLTGRLNLVSLLLQCDASVLIYDYRGYGRSQGIPSLPGLCVDGESAFDYLVKERNIPHDQIVIYGESLGSAVSCEIAGNRDCAAIILQSGFASLQKIGKKVMPFTSIYPDFLFPKPKLNTVAAMAKDNRPLLILHGKKDIVVPFAHAEEIYHRAAEPKQFVPLDEAAHSDLWSASPREYVESVRSFLKSL
jgi:fermentation-respiration switch protein FrsA (DUF1100 family)